MKLLRERALNLLIAFCSVIADVTNGAALVFFFIIAASLIETNQTLYGMLAAIAALQICVAAFTALRVGSARTLLQQLFHQRVAAAVGVLAGSVFSYSSNSYLLGGTY